LIPQTVPFYLEHKITENKLNLFVAGEIDFESIKQFNFEIFLSDNGTPSLNSTKTFQVNINDLNDNPPMFEMTRNSSEIKILHNGSPLNSIIHQYKASDTDLSSTFNFL
jgi:hypothetical protein